MAFFFSTPGAAFPARPDLILSRAAAARQSELRRERDRLARLEARKLLGLQDRPDRPAFFAKRRTPRRTGR